MKLLRQLHLCILFLLGSIVVFVAGALLFIVTHTMHVLPPGHFSDLLAPPQTAVQSRFFQGDTVTIHFESFAASTPSATLTHAVSVDEELFVPVGQAIHLPITSEITRATRTPQHILAWDPERVRAWITQASTIINTHAVLPNVLYTPRTSPPFTISAGKPGIGANIEDAVSRIIHNPTLTLTYTMQPMAVTPPLSNDEVAHVKQRLIQLTKSPLTFKAANRVFTISPTDISHLVSLPDGFSNTAIQTLLSTWAKDFDLATVEPDLVFDGEKISTFKAPVEGRSLDVAKNTPLVLAALQKLEEIGDSTAQELIVRTESPKITLDSLNSMGITERIGRGDSEYHHSIPNRIKNVALTTTHIHGSIIMPGETFSFNKALGDVSRATGFLPAYVISQGKTVLGDGGGVCQVSSTLFRALLDAGLPIIERRGHSYRVSYYEENSKPGFDATVSAPHPDLTFLNDTGAPILINAQADSAHVRMYVELYGKKDGRKAEIANYKQWDNSPAPPTLYQDDPTLPKGTLKQIDFAAGGLKTSFDYNVTYPDGHVKHTNYSTTYTPWRAVYLRGV